MNLNGILINLRRWAGPPTAIAGFSRDLLSYRSINLAEMARDPDCPWCHGDNDIEDDDGGCSCEYAPDDNKSVCDCCEESAEDCQCAANGCDCKDDGENSNAGSDME